MSYSITCPCGTTIPLKLTQAGSVVTCACGRESQVPSMSQLRQAAGQTPLPLSIVEQIELKIARGELPEEKQCAISGQPTDEFMQFHILCEQPWVSSGPMGTRTAVGLTLLLGWIGFFLAIGGLNRKQKEFGRETSLMVPLRIHPGQSGIVARYNQRKLRELLSHEPSYQLLLQEYPEAVISPRYSYSKDRAEEQEIRNPKHQIRNKF